MSKQVDERVVSMQFDNAQFERNVATTMSTLDKLKQKLNFSGASKGLEGVSASAKKVDMTGLANGVETVRTRFSAMEVVGVTALANITNQAVNTGKRMLSALTIDPIKTGFQEYETQMNAVQTILANTQSKGSTLDDVNAALEKLNVYADKTIYNFTEMTRNIGTFTAAGVDLQTSVESIQGIANLAAVSGSTSQQASTAMYQLSQALAAGRVSLMDWNSVVNAGMGGELFQNALLRTSELLKTGGKEAVNTYGSFRDSLTKGQWLTTEVLTETLKQLSGAYSEADLIAQGFTAEQAKEIASLAETATNAATKVKTFTQLWDVMKESAQSGWSQTWKLIIGDFEEAKSLLTPLADFFTGVITSMSEARNKLLEGALGKSFSSLGEKIKGFLYPAEKVSEAIKTVTSSVADLGNLVDEVIIGNFGNGADRFNALTEAGYNYYQVQNKVNEQLGWSFRYTEEQIAEQNKLLGIETKTAEAKSETAQATRELTDAEKERIAKLARLSDATLRSLGYTEEQIAAFRELKETAEKLGLPLDEFIKNIDEINGRWLLINSFKNVGQGIVAVITAMANAWKNIFPPMTSDQLFNIIAGLHRFSTALQVDTETSIKFRKTFEGVFALLDVVLTLVRGPLAIGFKLLGQLLGAFDMDILDVTANIGDAIVKFRDWIDSTLDFSDAFEKISGPVKKAIEAIKDWIKSLKSSENLPEDIAKGIANGFGKAVTFVKEKLAQLRNAIENGLTGAPDTMIGEFASKLWGGIKLVGQVLNELGKIVIEKIHGILTEHGFNEIPTDMISGFVNGIRNGITNVGQVMIEFGREIVNKIKDFLGIRSPSTVFFAIGGFLIAGLLLGIKSYAPEVWTYISEFAAKIAEFVKNMDFGSILATAIGTGVVVLLIKIAKTVEALLGPIEGLGEIFKSVSNFIDSASKTVKKFGKVLDSIKWAIKAEAIKSLAIALAILVGSVVVLTLLDPKKLLVALGAIAALAGIMYFMSKSASKLGTNAVEMGKSILLIAGIAASILVLAAAVKVIASVDADKFEQAMIGLTGAVIALSIVLAAMGVVANNTRHLKNIAVLGQVLFSMVAALLIMSLAIKVLGELDENQLKQGGAAIIAVVAGLVAITKLMTSKTHLNTLGGTLTSMASALLMLTAVIWLLAKIDEATFTKGIKAVSALGVMLGGMVFMTNLMSEKDMTGLGSVLMAMSATLLVMAVIVRLLGGLTPQHLIKGTLAVAALAGILTGMVAMTKLTTDKEMKGLATTLLAMSVAIGILALVAAVLGLLDVAHLAKGIIAVGMLSAMMALMIHATKNAQDCKGNLIVMTIAIVAMAAAVAALSLIDGKKLAGATIAMVALMGVFALLVSVGGKAKGAIGILIVLTVAIGLMAGVLYLLSTLPTESVLISALSLSAVMLAMSGVLLILSKMSGNAKNAITGAIALTAMAVPLLAFVGVLAVMQNVQNALDNALILSTLAAAMTLLLIPLTAIGKMWKSAFLGVAALTLMAVPMAAFIGVLALMNNVQNATKNVNTLVTLMTSVILLLIPLTLIGVLWSSAFLGIAALTLMAVPMVAFVGVVALMNKVQNAAENIRQLITLMSVMTVMLVALAIIGPLALTGVGALAALTLLIVGVGALAVGVGALMEKFPQLEEFLDKGIPILEKIAYAIGSLAGNLISGFVDTVAQSLPVVGTALSQFMINATPFIAGIKMVDASMLEGIGVLTAAILALTAADLVAGISSFIQGGSSFADLGTELSLFMTNAQPFILGASQLNEDMLAGVQMLADTILTLTKANVLEGLTAWFTGGNSLAEFGNQLVPFGEAMANFSNTVSGNIDEEAVMAAANAGKILSEMATTLPNSGGVVGFFTGENDLSTFTAQLIPFGQAMVAFSGVVAGQINEDAITAAANAGKTLIAMADTIPNSGGVVGFFAGENDIATFGIQLVSFGNSMVLFSNTVAGNIDETAITAAANAGKIMLDLANTLPNTGGAVAWFTGDNDIETFGIQLVSFGNSMVEFSQIVSGNIDEGAITAAANAGSMLAALANSLPDSGGFGSWFSADNDMSTFGRELKSFGGSLADFSDEVSGVDCTQLAVVTSRLRNLVSMATSMSGVDFSSLGSFGKNLKKIGKDGIDLFINAFKDAENRVSTTVKAFVDKGLEAINKKDVEFKNAGSKLVEKFADGIEAKKETAKSKAKTMAGDAATATKDKYQSFYNAGSYLVDGFAAGISENTFKAEAEAAAMAAAALEAAEEELGIQSPSKEFYKIGAFTGQGFINALRVYADKAYQSTTEMAKSARSGLSDAIGKVVDVFNTDMDTQPTIRPVVDLSDVRTGAAAVSSLFNRTSSVGVLANVGKINSSMNGRVQNGDNSDVVSAINKLRSELGNVGSTSYHIDGVTYDDGSNIAEAMQEIVKAAKIERRM